MSPVRSIHDKISGKVDGSDVDPTAPQDAVGGTVSEDTVDQYAEQILADNHEEFKDAIKNRLMEKLSPNSEAAVSGN